MTTIDEKEQPVKEELNIKEQRVFDEKTKLEELLTVADKFSYPQMKTQRIETNRKKPSVDDFAGFAGDEERDFSEHFKRRRNEATRDIFGAQEKVHHSPSITRDRISLGKISDSPYRVEGRSFKSEVNYGSMTSGLDNYGSDRFSTKTKSSFIPENKYATSDIKIKSKRGNAINSLLWV